MNFPAIRPDPTARAMGASVGATSARAAEEAKLKKSAEALEQLFVQQLFQAMRASVPTDGLMERGPGEDLFSGMLDQKVAEEVAVRGGGQRDLSVSLFAALRDRLGAPADTGR
jgi:Rod binding domain-containing protein